MENIDEADCETSRGLEIDLEFVIDRIDKRAQEEAIEKALRARKVCGWARICLLVRFCSPTNTVADSLIPSICSATAPRIASESISLLQGGYDMNITTHSTMIKSGWSAIICMTHAAWQSMLSPVMALRLPKLL